MSVESQICEHFNIQVRLNNPQGPDNFNLAAMSDPKALGLTKMLDPRA